MTYGRKQKTSTFTALINNHIGHPLSNDNSRLNFMRSQQVTTSLISRLGLTKELKGHQGCVNCLEWSQDGCLLASGSDDCNAIVWDPHRHRSVVKIPTGHAGNIFSVNFMPHSANSTLVSGAADSRVIVSDVTRGQPVHVYQCHSMRVKRLATARDSAFLFWSASEDGTVRQFDLRDKDTGQQSRSVLVDLSCLLHQNPNPEAKCLSVNPCRSEMLALGANDHCLRLFDRRMLSLTRAKSQGSQRSGPTSEAALGDADAPDSRVYSKSAQYYIPGHLTRDSGRPKRQVAITYVTFSPDGRDLVANLGGEQVYTVRVVGGTQQPVMQLSPELLLPEPSNNRSRASPPAADLPAAAQALKCRANEELQSGLAAVSVRLYTEALQLAPGSPLLLGNRAAALLKRRWDGDAYAAALDCQDALAADVNHYKALYRLTRAFVDLGWSQEAKRCLEAFNSRFPDRTGSANFRELADAVANVGEASRQRPAGLGRQFRGYEPPQLSEAELELRNRALDLRQRFVGHCNTTTDIKEANFFGSDFLMAGSDEGNFFVWDRRDGALVRVLKGDESIVNCLQPHPTTCLLASSGIDPVVRLWSPQPVADAAECGDSATEAEAAGGRTSGSSLSGLQRTSASELDEAVARNQRLMRADPLEMMLRSMGYRLMPARGADSEDEDSEGDGPAGDRGCRTS